MTIENITGDPDENVIEDVLEEEAAEIEDAEEEAPDEDAIEEEADDEGDEEEEESAYIDFEDDDGNVYQIPEALKSAIMRQKDYTQKTQTVAEEKKALEAERESFKAMSERTEEEFKLGAAIYNVDEQLAKYKNVDWTQLEQQDPDNANSHFRQMQLLQQRKAELAQHQQELTAQKSQEVQQSAAKRLEEAQKWAVENVPNFGTEYLNGLREYAESLGYDSAALQSNMSVRFLKALHDGYTGNQIKQKAAKPKTKQKGKIVPLKKVGAKSGTTTRVDLATADMDAYVKARKRGVGG